MRIVALAVAAGALLAATHANAASFPVNRMSGVDSGLVDQIAVRVYVHEGRRYCFYFNGWHGPGWYRCGFAFRRGYGWGGVYGWNDWSYGPYERRYGRHHHREGGARIGIRSGSDRSRTTIDTHSRSTTTTGTNVDTGGRRSTTSGNVRSTTSGNVQTRSRSTTGSGPGVNVQSGGGANVQGGAHVQQRGGSSGGGANVQQHGNSGGANVQGGASVGTPDQKKQ